MLAKIRKDRSKAVQVIPMGGTEAKVLITEWSG